MTVEVSKDRDAVKKIAGMHTATKLLHFLIPPA